MATTAQRLTALETALAAQKAWNVKVNDRLAKLEAPVVVPPPIIVPPPVIVPVVKQVGVTTVPALLAALASDDVDAIVVANGTYYPARSGDQAANSLWIGAKFAGRTRPILVRAATPGGVILDGGGMSGYGAISFEGGAHHQTWQGFTFANGTANDTGVVMFGGYTPVSTYPVPHHITLLDFTCLSTIHSSYPPGVYHDHFVAFGFNSGHDHLLDRFTVDGTSSARIDSAVQFYHSDATNLNAQDVILRHFDVTGTKNAFMVWDATTQRIAIEDTVVRNAVKFAVRYEDGGTLALRRVVSTASGEGGFYSSLGANPPGVTFDSCSLA